eukprot:1822387-Ditylum_brightwellii.AAC.1
MGHRSVEISIENDSHFRRRHDDNTESPKGLLLGPRNNQQTSIIHMRMNERMYVRKYMFDRVCPQNNILIHNKRSAVIYTPYNIIKSKFAS